MLTSASWCSSFPSVFIVSRSYSSAFSLPSDMKNLGSFLLLLAASTSYVASSSAGNGVIDVGGGAVLTLEGQWQHMPVSQRRCIILT